MTDVVTRLVVRGDGSLAVLDQFENKMGAAGKATDRTTGAVANYEARMAKARAAMEAGNAVSTETVARRSAEQRAFDTLAASVDKGYALHIRQAKEAERAAAAAANAVNMGYISEQEGLVALMAVERQHMAQRQQADEIARARAAEALAAASSDGQASWNSYAGVGTGSGKSAREVAAVFEAELSRLDDIARMRAEQIGATFGAELNARLVADTGKSARDAAAVFQTEMDRLDDIARMAAQEAGQAFNQDFNARMGIGNAPISARESAAVFEEAAREADEYARRLGALKAAIDPASVAQSRYNAELAEYSIMAQRGDVSTDELAQAQIMLKGRLDATLASVTRLNTSGKGAATGTFNTANIAAQFQDIGVTASMGMNPLQIALQQGTQLSAVFATMEKPLEGIVMGLKSIISPVSLLTIGIIALVAAGLQFVDWGSVAQSTLNFLADGLEVIAPYAAAAAIGLALLYSSAILSGLVAVVGSLGTVATAVWGLATAIYATVGLPALLIAGFIALVAAAVIWRDDLTKMLGFDIIGAAQTGINSVIGFFVGGFNAIGAVWSNLGAVFQEIMWNVGQEIARGFEAIVRNAAANINDLIGLVPEQFRMGVSPIDVGAIKFTSAEANPNAGAGANVGRLVSDAMGDAQGIDYAGKAIEFVQDAAGGAADAMRSLADGMDVDAKAAKAAAKETERQAEAYRDLTRDAHQFIAEQQLEAQALGMTEEAANRLKYEQDMLNKAANDNIDLTPKQTAELGALATAMAAAEEQTRRLTEIYDTGKQIFSSFFGDLKSGIEDGKGLWASLGDAALNALDSIASKALDMAANGIWDMIFNGIMSGMGGGFGSLGNGIGAGAGSFGNFSSLMSFAGGGDTGAGARSGGLDGMGGFLAMMHPNETVKDNTRPANNNFRSGNDNRSSQTTLRLIMPDGWRAEVVDEARSGARQDTVQIVQENDKAQRNYRQNGGN